MKSISKPIRQLIDQDLRSFRDLRPRRPVGEDNITVHQQQALNKLKSRHEIIIKPADKGGQIVIQDRTNYILEATRQLNDPVYYRPLTQPMYLETQAMVRVLIILPSPKNTQTPRELDCSIRGPSGTPHSK